MNIRISFFLLLFLCLMGCRSPTSVIHTPDTLAQTICSSQDISMEALDAESVQLWLREFYRIPDTFCSDCAIYRASLPASAAEIAVIQLTGTAGHQEVLDSLEAYRLARQGDFTGYDPEQAAMVEDGMVLLSADKQCIALLICPQPRQAADLFFAALEQTVSQTTPPPPSPFPPERTPFRPPGRDDMTLYDTSNILLAWRSGDESRLSDKEQVILRRCRDILATCITEDMSEWEREWAIYSWLTSHVDYDYSHYDPRAVTPRESYEPYGPLVDGLGICLGYATTFQLFMDLLEVECITVVGAAFQSREDHAWNMVRLNGEWYCVDATWDASSGGKLNRCRYFNVTSQHMADTDHQWDDTSVPEATATDGGRGTRSSL